VFWVVTTEGLAVGVVGLGYVGLPLSIAMSDAGYSVTGVDIDAETVGGLREGRSHVSDVADAEVIAAQQSGLTFTSEYDALADASLVSICVPTPLRKTGTPDLSFVITAAERLAGVVSDGCTVVLESTVYPGATEDILADILSEAGLRVGEDVHLAFSPERIDPGNSDYGPEAIPKVIGGATGGCGDRAQALYESVFDEVVRVNSATEAELVKLLENTFRAVNIGLINELAQVAHALDVDIWNVIEAAKTKPFGFMPFYPGPGLGGHCIPIDPFYLSWKANEHGIETRFIDLADTVNREMPGHVVHRIVAALNEHETAMSSAEILLVGVAYKPDVSDVRESPAIDIIEELRGWGASVAFHDPHATELEVEGRIERSVPLAEDRVSAADCVVIVTDHSAIDIGRIVEHARLVFDTRNACSGEDAQNVVKL
jgi:UDP-N-acetyl-D-glucosamine dehydrogenase